MPVLYLADADDSEVKGPNEGSIHPEIIFFKKICETN
jgi:hypothetical protein